MEKRVAAYCRVSTDMQTGGMESQIRVLKTYCEQNGISNKDLPVQKFTQKNKTYGPSTNSALVTIHQAGSTFILVSWAPFSYRNEWRFARVFWYSFL